MIELVMMAALAVGGAPASGQDAACAQYAQTARTLMRARQGGAEIERVMAPIEGIRPESRERARALVLEAYGKPRWETEERQRRAVEDFGNEAYLACVSG